jgi:hypothetical protein
MTGFGDSTPGKRPAPTIEGTATEIKEPPEAASTDAASEAGPTETASVDEGTSAKAKSPPRTSMPELKGFVTHLAAGLLGGLIGVLALSLFWNKLPAPSNAAAKPDLTKIEQRIGALEAAPKEAVGVSGLDTRIKILETKKPDAAPAPDLSELTARVARLEDSLKALGETASAGGSIADAAALDTKVSDLQQKLQARIDAKLAEGDASDRQAIDEMKSALADLNTKVGALSVAERGADQDAASAKSAASVLAFANLRAAIDSGRAYATELAALRSLAPAIGNFGALPAFAEQGIPTLAELTTSFKTASDAAIDAEPTASTGDESFFGSVLQSAKSMVRVRRIDGNATGDDPDSVLARAAAKLRQGDLVAAIQDAESLQGPPRQSLSSWIDAARARASAEDTLSRLETSLREQAETAAPPPNQIP